MFCNFLRRLCGLWNFRFHIGGHSSGSHHRSHRHDWFRGVLATGSKKILILALFASAKSFAGPKPDVDLSIMSKTMVYSEVYHMMMSPKDYEGKIVKIKGTLAVYQDEETGVYYTAVLIADAAACCQQGLEFEWMGHKYPKGFPKVGSKITITGKFTTYEEGGMTYIKLLTDKVD